MSEKKMPKNYMNIKEKYPDVTDAVEKLGSELKKAGPIDLKTSHLIQLAAAASIHSEGSVHSHTKRAIEAGATHDEIRHAIILLASTIGFPSVAMALSWANDILEK